MAKRAAAKGMSSKTRGTRAGGALKGGGRRSSRGRSPSMTFGRHGPSVKKDNTYEALRRKGYSKEKSARIANAQHNGTIGHGVRGPAGGGKRKSRSGRKGPT